jgi:hypothetical protein
MAKILWTPLWTPSSMLIFTLYKAFVQSIYHPRSSSMRGRRKSLETRLSIYINKLQQKFYTRYLNDAIRFDVSKTLRGPAIHQFWGFPGWGKG